MKQPVSAARTSGLKWTGLWLLQIPIYLATSYFMRTLIGGGYRLVIRGGANLPPNFLLQHFLWLGLAGGFFAGLIGLQLLRASLLIFPSETALVVDDPWKRPQAWSWVLPGLFFAFGVLAWLDTPHSVLAVGPTGPGLVATFFGAGCDLSGGRITSFVAGTCVKQVTFSHLWLGTLGYSIAAFVPKRWGIPSRISTAPTVTDPSAQEQAAR